MAAPRGVGIGTAPVTEAGTAPGAAPPALLDVALPVRLETRQTLRHLRHLQPRQPRRRTASPIAPLTTYLTFGPISAAGEVNVKIIYDHRVMDGRTVARCLCDLEEMLNTAILEEVTAMAPRPGPR